MRIMHVEDEDDYKRKVKTILGRGVKIIPYTGIDAKGAGFDQDTHLEGSNPIELQIIEQIKSYEDSDGEIDLVLLDTDLVGLKNSISYSAVRSACSSLGIPVCRYSKKGFISLQERMKYLATIAREGSQSILIPLDILLDEDELPVWLKHVSKSFKRLRTAINKHSNETRLLPSDLIANMLNVPGIDIELLGYSGANFFFFGDLMEGVDSGEEVSDRHYSTQFGYWLYNYVMLFPGPIMNASATAAYVGLKKESIEKEEITELLEKARYKGPFSQLGTYYVKQKLDSILIKSDSSNFESYLTNSGLKLSGLNLDINNAPYFYCVVNDEPIPAGQAIGPLDWIPRGATMCRIKKSTYEKLGPWVNV